MSDWTNLPNRTNLPNSTSDCNNQMEALAEHFRNLLAEHNPEIVEEALKSVLDASARTEQSNKSPTDSHEGSGNGKQPVTQSATNNISNEADQQSPTDSHEGSGNGKQPVTKLIASTSCESRQMTTESECSQQEITQDEINQEQNNVTSGQGSSHDCLDSHLMDTPLEQGDDQCSGDDSADPHSGPSQAAHPRMFRSKPSVQQVCQ